jgi:DNA-binding NarL/FixJ family response regulator
VALQVAIVDPLPLYRHGIGAILAAAGHDVVEAPQDVVMWARSRRDGLILLSLCSEQDWRLLAQLCAEEAGPRLIAVVDDASGVHGARAVQTGAHSVLSRDASIRSLERAVAVTVDGEAVMPMEVLRALASGVRPPPPRGPMLSAEQLSWLNLLAEGSTVARLASEAGYSERAMFRLLHTLYRKLGARNRIEALLRAQELGWLQSGT